MSHLTIQLAFDFDFTEAGLYEAIELLEFAVHNELALASLRAYNQIFAAIQHCKNNEVLTRSVCSHLFGRLVASHRDVLTLNGVY